MRVHTKKLQRIPVMCLRGHVFSWCGTYKSQNLPCTTCGIATHSQKFLLRDSFGRKVDLMQSPTAAKEQSVYMICA